MDESGADGDVYAHIISLSGHTSSPSAPHKIRMTSSHRRRWQQKVAWIFLAALALISLNRDPSIVLNDIGEKAISSDAQDSKTDISGTLTSPMSSSMTTSVDSIFIQDLKVSTKNNIHKIRILGERHSGTSFFTKFLQKCFNETSSSSSAGIEIDDTLVNGKHWFQPSPRYVQNIAKVYGKNKLDPTLIPNHHGTSTWWDIAQNPVEIFEDSLVLILVRDPFQWMEAMRRGPHHWPNHYSIWLLSKNGTSTDSQKYNPNRRSRFLQRASSNQEGPRTIQKTLFNHSSLPWQEFVKRPMHIQEGKNDNPNEYNNADSDPLCQKGIPVSPCEKMLRYRPPSITAVPKSFVSHLAWSINQPVYELRPDKNPFQHPLDMRAAKIRNWLDLPAQWNLGGFGVIRYETLLSNLPAVLEEIGRAVRQKPQCEQIKYTKEPYSIPKEFEHWINDHADWQQEGRLGYHSSAV